MVNQLKKGNAYLFRTKDGIFDCIGIVRHIGKDIDHNDAKMWDVSNNSSEPAVVVQIIEYCRTKFSRKYIRIYNKELTRVEKAGKAAQVLYASTNM